MHPHQRRGRTPTCRGRALAAASPGPRRRRILRGIPSHRGQPRLLVPVLARRRRVHGLSHLAGELMEMPDSQATQPTLAAGLRLQRACLVPAFHHGLRGRPSYLRRGRGRPARTTTLIARQALQRHYPIGCTIGWHMRTRRTSTPQLRQPSLAQG